jgi:propionyl-CoA carboxylase beta chain
VVKTVTHEDVDREHLGGASVHTVISGVAHLAAPDEAAAIDYARRILDHLPQNNLSKPLVRETADPIDRRDESLNSVVPDEANQPYDMHDVISRVVDDADFLEIQPHWAANILVGFARLGGRSVGIVAHQPEVLAGALDIDASDKAARFVRTCDAFNVPLVTFEDVPGFLPGVTQEHGGIIRHGAKLLYAYAEATVPKLTVITRKAYGGAYDVMSSKHIRGDVNLAWPSASIAVMGPEGAVNIIFRDEIAAAADVPAERARLRAEYEERFANPYIAAGRGYIDDVIEPADTRPRLIAALVMLDGKRQSNLPRKHGNIPL